MPLKIAHRVKSEKVLILKTSLTDRPKFKAHLISTLLLNLLFSTLQQLTNAARFRVVWSKKAKRTITTTLRRTQIKTLPFPPLIPSRTGSM